MNKNKPAKLSQVTVEQAEWVGPWIQGGRQVLNDADVVKLGMRPIEEKAMNGKYSIELSMLGSEATEEDLEKMVRALRVRGYETQRGLVNGTAGEIPDAVWFDCLAHLNDHR